MDFMEQLVLNVNKIPNLPVKCKLGYLTTSDSLCMYSLPGGRVTGGYYDGTKNQELNYEFSMKSKNLKSLNETLWLIQNHLEGLSTLESADNSFSFDSIYITNKPFISQMDDTQYYIFALTVQAKITTNRR